MEEKSFSLRRFVVVLLSFAFFCALLSGFALYIQPSSKIAFWTGWSFVGLSKVDWTNLHVLFVLLFLVTATFHIWFNWKLLINAISGGKRMSLFNREVLIALMIILVLFLSGIYRIPPLSYILDGKDSFRGAGIEDKRSLPPLWDADKVSFLEFCRKLGINHDVAIKELRDAGYVFDDSSRTLFNIADKNEVSPLVLYERIRKFQTKRRGMGE